MIVQGCNACSCPPTAAKQKEVSVFVAMWIFLIFLNGFKQKYVKDYDDQVYVH
jgi:hypothetical protein